VAFAGQAFPGAFFMVKALAVKLLEPFDILVLRHDGFGEVVGLDEWDYNREFRLTVWVLKTPVLVIALPVAQYAAASTSDGWVFL
jgi:hypothetical protein